MILWFLEIFDANSLILYDFILGTKISPSFIIDKHCKMKFTASSTLKKYLFIFGSVIDKGNLLFNSSFQISNTFPLVSITFPKRTEANLVVLTWKPAQLVNLSLNCFVVP